MSLEEVRQLSEFNNVLRELSVLISRLPVEHGHAVSVLQHQRSQLQFRNKQLEDELERLRRGLNYRLEAKPFTLDELPNFPELAKTSNMPKLMGGESTPQVCPLPRPMDSMTNGDISLTLDDKDEVGDERQALTNGTPMSPHSGRPLSSGQLFEKSAPPDDQDEETRAPLVDSHVDSVSAVHFRPIDSYVSDDQKSPSKETKKVSVASDVSRTKDGVKSSGVPVAPPTSSDNLDSLMPSVLADTGGQKGINNVVDNEAKKDEPVAPRPAGASSFFKPTNQWATSSASSVKDNVPRGVVEVFGDIANEHNRRAFMSVFSIGDEDMRRRDAAVVASPEILAEQAKEMSVLTTRERIKSMVNSMSFEMFFAFVIITNSIFMGVQIDYNVTYPERETHPSFYAIGYSYTFLFAVELGLRLVADGWRFFVSKTNWQWHYLDFAIVCSSIVEVILDVIDHMDNAKEGEDSVNMSNVRIVRVIRITRLIKVFRVARIVRFVRALRTLVYSILCTLKSVVWALLLLFMIIYVFGMVFAQAVSDFIVDNPNGYMLNLYVFWGSLPRSMFTLYKAIAGGISWHDAVLPLGDLDGVWVAVFMAYISFTFFAVLNTITGVFCEAAIESARQDHEMVIQQHLANKKKYTQQIRALFDELDPDSSAMITFKELEQVLSDERTVAFLATLELEASDAWELFKLLDSDDSQTIDIDEFVTGCMRLKGNAKAIDIAKISYDFKMMHRSLSRFMKDVKESFVHIKKGMALDREAASISSLTFPPMEKNRMTRESAGFESMSVNALIPRDTLNSP